MYWKEREWRFEPVVANLQQQKNVRLTWKRGKCHIHRVSCITKWKSFLILTCLMSQHQFG